MSVLHIRGSNPSPSQGKPPKAGEGLLQTLSLMMIPPPQVLEHGVSVHSDHPPSTGKGTDDSFTHSPAKHIFNKTIDNKR